jgi:rhodanese-related sulfurtransferase
MGQLLEFTNNHPVLVSGTLLMALAVIFYEIRMRASGLTSISAAQAVRVINQGGKVVDVRDKEHFDAGHIVDAINIPASQLSNGAKKRLKKNRPLLLVCDNGSRSGQCVESLRKAGYESTFSLQGGLTAWERENLPLVRPNPGP